MEEGKHQSLAEKLAKVIEISSTSVGTNPNENNASSWKNYFRATCHKRLKDIELELQHSLRTSGLKVTPRCFLPYLLLADIEKAKEFIEIAMTVYPHLEGLMDEEKEQPTPLEEFKEIDGGQIYQNSVESIVKQTPFVEDTEINFHVEKTIEEDEQKEQLGSIKQVTSEVPEDHEFYQIQQSKEISSELLEVSQHRESSSFALSVKEPDFFLEMTEILVMKTEEAIEALLVKTPVSPWPELRDVENFFENLSAIDFSDEVENRQENLSKSKIQPRMQRRSFSKVLILQSRENQVNLKTQELQTNWRQMNAQEASKKTGDPEKQVENQNVEQKYN